MVTYRVIYSSTISFNYHILNLACSVDKSCVTERDTLSLSHKQGGPGHADIVTGPCRVAGEMREGQCVTEVAIHRYRWVVAQLQASCLQLLLTPRLVTITAIACLTTTIRFTIIASLSSEFVSVPK